MTTRPPRSTLCPYTTLFRSYASRLPRGRSYVRNGSVVDLQIAKGQVTALVSGTSLYKIKITVEAGARDQRDRKSTRLNSSHPSISYAVFCLKKKNNNN